MGGQIVGVTSPTLIGIKGTALSSTLGASATVTRTFNFSAGNFAANDSAQIVWGILLSTGCTLTVVVNDGADHTYTVTNGATTFNGMAFAMIRNGAQNLQIPGINSSSAADAITMASVVRIDVKVTTGGGGSATYNGASIMVLQS